ncbi:MAG: alpha/beta fold hydrolase [Anaerolineales bacterium]
MTTQAIKEQQKKINYHRPYQRTYFKANDMDFVFQWLMGSAVHGGAGIGESYYAASRMKDGDPASWAREWTALAERVRARAEGMLRAGYTVSAREGYLRAVVYYRAVLASMLPDHPQFKPVTAAMQECFRTGSAMLEPPVERFEILFEGARLPGYFQKAAAGDVPRPTLLMIGGAETFAEDLYYFIAPAAIRRRWNFATVDLPGQGDTPFQGLAFRSDTEVPMKSVLDALLARPDVDPRRLAAYGISAGGYFVPRAAAFDRRIRACVANSMLFNFYEQWDKSNIRRVKGIYKMIATWKAPFVMRMGQLMAWRWGVDINRLFDLPEKNRAFVFDPARIQCPTLILIGEGEFQNPIIRSQQERAMAALPNPSKKFIIGPLDEGAGAHCLGANLGLMSALVFDWLEEVFQDPG